MEHYWRGDPVAQRIHQKAWLVPGWQDKHLAELDDTSIIGMHMENPITAERAIRSRAEIISRPGEDVQGLVTAMRQGVRCCVVRRFFRAAHRRFFLEPVLTNAFADAKLNKLTMDQVPPILEPIAIHLPDGLVRYERENLSGDLRTIYICEDEQYQLAGKKQHHITVMVHVHDSSTGLTCPYAHTIYVPEDSNLEDFMRGAAVGAQGTSDYEKREYAVSGLVCRIMFSTLLYWKSHNADILQAINPRWKEVWARAQNAPTKKQRKKGQQRLAETPKGPHEVLGAKLETLRRRAEADIHNSDADAAGAARMGDRGGWKQCLHWRGWFWRNQPCGKGMKDRRLVFIGPHTAGAGASKAAGTRMDA
jgi:hypothetical protein